MKTFLSALGIAVLITVFGAPLAADHHLTSVTGEVIDVVCYKKDGAKATGDDHESCATGCAKRGNVMGILAADGVYTIVGDYTNDKNAKLVEFVAKKVDVTGEVTEKDGQKSISVATMQLAK